MGFSAAGRDPSFKKMPRPAALGDQTGRGKVLTGRARRAAELPGHSRILRVSG
jgi:hypothetical protein